MRKSEFMKIRVAEDERQAFESAAERAGISLSAWVRERLRKVAAAELESAGIQIPFFQSKPGVKTQ